MVDVHASKRGKRPCNHSPPPRSPPVAQARAGSLWLHKESLAAMAKGRGDLEGATPTLHLYDIHDDSPVSGI